jgi:nicotinamide-nucleotide amidase
MVTRAGIVVTGTEVLTGRVADANGPWLAEQLRRLGLDVGRIVVVGDRPDDLLRALAWLAEDHDLVITSGGLGPTADDLTTEVVAELQGREPRLDTELEQRISGIVERLVAARGWTPDPEATRAATRKQALVPHGAHVLEPTGTAPGLVVPVADGRDGPPVIVLPGPPAELQGMWDDAVADPLVQQVVAGQQELHQSTLRLWGTPESELAATLRRHHDRLAGLEITTCLREGGELEIVTRYSPESVDAYAALVAAVRDDFPGTLFSADGRTVAEIVTDALLDRGATIATAESCTAGLLAGRLADRAGSSAYLLGGLVTYADAAKRDLLGVPQRLLDDHGAVSAEVAEAMAAGARARLGATVGVGITGIAGPGGGTPDKPVGLVHLCASTEDRTVARRVVLPGSRAAVRARSVVVALHLVRELLDADDAPR